MAAKKKSNRPKKYNTKINWHAIREDYLVRNLDKSQKTYTIVALAKEWGVSRKQIDIHAHAENWRGELRRRTKSIADARIEAHTDALKDQQRAIRERHVEVAGGVISKAVQRFNAITNPEEEISLDLMLKMFAFGLPAQRDAIGMPKLVQIQDVSAQDVARQFETPEMRMERRRIEQEVDDDLAKAYVGLSDAGD